MKASFAPSPAPGAPIHGSSAQALGGEVAGLRISLPTLDIAVETASRLAVSGQGFTLFTLNLDHLVKIRAHAAFRAAYDRAALVTADGWPVVWLARRAGGVLERTCGSDLVEPLCAVAAEQGIGLYFIGPGPKAQAVALERLSGRYDGLRIVGAETPAVPADFATTHDFDLDALAGRVNTSGARLFIVSLGAPKQELLADALARLCPEVGFVCVGAALDFISGETRRAPAWVRAIKLEWFWRFAAQPRRLGMRYALCAIEFARLALGSFTNPKT